MKALAPRLLGAFLLANSGGASAAIESETVMFCFGDLASYLSIVRNTATTDYQSWYQMESRVVWWSTWWGYSGDWIGKDVPINATDYIAQETWYKDQFPPQTHYNTSYYGRSTLAIPPQWQRWQESRSCNTA